MNKKITASLCAILFLLAGCVKKETPDLEVSPENAPTATVSEASDDTQATPSEKRKQVDVIATQNPCWVKVDKLWLNMSNINQIRALHSIEQYGVLLERAEVYNESTQVFIPTDQPEAVIDEMMNQTQKCGTT